jgi:subtilase family serine protease
VHFSWTPSSCGSHLIAVNVDPDPPKNVVHECDENNNKKTQSVDVKGPDLIVEPITVSQPTTIGTPIKFTVIIKNKGTSDAGISYMRCYVDELPIGDRISVPAINRGQSSTHDVSWTASGCGPHTFKAVADVDLNVIECDEENNDKQTSFTVKHQINRLRSLSLSRIRVMRMRMIQR